jgi:hypothetical protein
VVSVNFAWKQGLNDLPQIFHKVSREETTRKEMAKIEEEIIN